MFTCNLCPRMCNAKRGGEQPGQGKGVDWDYVRKNLEGYEGIISLELKKPAELSNDEFYAAAFEAAKFVKS